MKPTDTHYYDNKIDPDIIRIINNLNIPNNDLNNLRNKLIESKINKTGLSYFDKIITNKNNYDPVNKLDIIKLLHIIDHLSNDNSEIITIMKEQLDDLKTGFCLQGRSIRLLQIIIPFINHNL